MGLRGHLSFVAAAAGATLLSIQCAPRGGGDTVPKTCVEKIGREACPVGADPDVSASAAATCSAKGSGSVVTTAGKIEGVCKQSEGCTFICRARADVCKPCGVRTMTVAQIDCFSPAECAPACGHDGSPCCSGNTPCDPSSMCVTGRCTACGALDQPCCAAANACRLGICAAEGRCKCPPRRAPSAEPPQTRVKVQETKEYHGGPLGISVDDMIGGPCSPGCARLGKKPEVVKVGGNGSAMPYDFPSDDPGDCRARFHVGAPVLGGVKVAITVREECQPAPPPPLPPVAGCE